MVVTATAMEASPKRTRTARASGTNGAAPRRLATEDDAIVATPTFALWVSATGMARLLITPTRIASGSRRAFRDRSGGTLMATTTATVIVTNAVKYATRAKVKVKDTARRLATQVSLLTSSAMLSLQPSVPVTKVFKVKVLPKVRILSSRLPSARFISLMGTAPAKALVLLLSTCASSAADRQVQQVVLPYCSMFECFRFK
mmetsp:Transcript_32103/g.72791  ORF Transcript_32103/g.72791 Transcript_32103/m.72791 type:complete len:201 (+) Transcript_32103:277-879(+)